MVVFIGGGKEFGQQQMNKVERCKKEAERIKKGIFQTKVMIDSACTDTLSGECDKNKAQREGIKTEEDGENEQRKKLKKPDIMEEMQKMIAAGGRHGQ